MKNIFIVFIVAVAAGCRTGLPPVYCTAAQVPGAVTVQAAVQFAAVRACLEQSCGITFHHEQPYALLLRKGEKMVDGLWVWYEPSAGYDIGGYSNGNCVMVGCNPITFGEVSDGVLYHELGHHLLRNEFGDATHNPLYDACLHWSGLPNR